MTERRSIEVSGFSHGPQPIPAASRAGNLVATGGIGGMDPASGAFPDSPERQVQLMFAQLERILAAAGASLNDVIKMTFWVRTAEVRPLINKAWIAAFPDPQSRPARHTLQNDHLPLNLVVQCDALAVISNAG
jgi:2-iminobutanoate/2-iminopropanoate deaminase